MNAEQKTSAKKSYNPSLIESQYYKIWEERGYFEVDGNKKIQRHKEPFCIMLPPPNITGNLHIGHALNHTLIDIIVRYKRMDGYKTLWQPGVDHAGIATQNVVEKQVIKEGLSKEQLGRTAFLERIWKWKEQSGNIILQQMRSLGSSCAWSRTRFTMDKGLAASVRTVFSKLYDKKMIYRGKYMINWCTHDGALSDIEVEYEENNANLYHIRYKLAGSDSYIIVATTRPETYFGDSAVMVHPHDERYKHLIGKKVILPLLNRQIPIIADETVDMDFGSGAVKVTPAHDFNDYEVGKRHGLEFITIFDSHGILNDYAGQFKGLERLQARSVIVQELDKINAIEKIESHKNQIGKCYRCGNIIEPYISQQWFIKKELAQNAIAQINTTKAATFYPEQWKNNYNSWMRELRDWCISRQLWWGHQIPVFYCDCGHEFCSTEEKPTQCPKCHSANFKQDSDVLDTWFSSALWPFSTLGYANGEFGHESLWYENDLKEFYPNTLLITGFDILFFWVARMLMMGEYALKQLPFKDIYLHALVRDEKGQKMSKSKGNIIDPLVIIQSHSADALRFTLATLCALGRDVKLSNTQLEISKNFTNKLYNAANFLLLHHESFTQSPIHTDLGLYMQSRLQKTIEDVRSSLDLYRFNEAATALYRFLWGEFCDWGIELAKAQKESIIELSTIFLEALKLLHPFMPFITEYLYTLLSGQELDTRDSIMIMPYPIAQTRNKDIERSFALIIDAIISIRRLKANLDLASHSSLNIYLQLHESTKEELLQTFIPRLSKVQSVTIVQHKIQDSIADIGKHVCVYITKSNVDLSSIIDRLHKQLNKTQNEYNKIQNMLSNKNFILNAPKELIAKNENNLKELAEKLDKISAEIHNIQS